MTAQYRRFVALAVLGCLGLGVSACSIPHSNDFLSDAPYYQQGNMKDPEALSGEE